MSEILSSNQVMERYQITAKTLVAWKTRLKLPFLAFGREHRYRMVDLETWERIYRVPREPEAKHSPKTILSMDMVLPSRRKDGKG
jgi:hypothetical protein